jgi:hypothetical protein
LNYVSHRGQIGSHTLAATDRGDTPPGEIVGAALFVGAIAEAVQEGVATARAMVNHDGDSGPPFVLGP